jgi:two-component sensor histidine kinase
LNNKESRIRAGVEGGAVAAGLGQAVPFGLLLNELVSNACQHAFPEGRAGTVTVRVSRENSYNVLSVADDGAGLPPHVDYHNAGTLGLQLVHMLAQQLGGSVHVVPGTGAVFHVRFPAIAATPEAGL